MYRVEVLMQTMKESDDDFKKRVEAVCDAYDHSNWEIITVALSVFVTTVHFLMFASITVKSR